MRRFMMTLGSTALVLGCSFVALGQDKAPPAQAPSQAPKQAPMQAPEQAPAKQAPMQAPMQAPAKQAPMQAPTQKLAPVQAPTQAPAKAPMQAPTQSPVQKGGAAPGYVPNPPAASAPAAPQSQTVAMGRTGMFRRFR